MAALENSLIKEENLPVDPINILHHITRGRTVHSL
jgi:hypothetical protein